MILGVDFDGTLVGQDRPYDDLTTPLQLLPGAKEALIDLKRAGHVLLLYSARANRALRENPDLDPLVRAGRRRIHRGAWESARPLHEARYQQMVKFVAEALPGLFDAVDDGQQGKPVCDLFIDDHVIRIGDGINSVGWPQIARMLGEPEEVPHDSRSREEPRRDRHRRRA